MLFVTPFTTVPSGDDMQQKEVYQEIEHSFYERWLITNLIGPNKPAFAVSGGTTVAGTDVQDFNFWSDRQTAFTDLMTDSNTNDHPFFLPADLAGSFPDLNDQSGYSVWDITSNGPDELWTFATNGKTGGGTRPRRRTTMVGYPGGGWATPGYCVAGDVIGPWLIEDIHDAFVFMSFTVRLDANNAGQTHLPNDANANTWFEGLGATLGVASAAHDVDAGNGWLVSADPTSIASHLEGYAFYTGPALWWVVSRSALGQATVSSLDVTLSHQGTLYFMIDRPSPRIWQLMDSMVGITGYPRYVNMGDMNFGANASHQFIWDNNVAQAGWSSIEYLNEFFQQAGPQSPNDTNPTGNTAYGWWFWPYINRVNPLWTLNWEWTYGK